jgi:hypothetical protein
MGRLQYCCMIGVHFVSHVSNIYETRGEGEWQHLVSVEGCCLEPLSVQVPTDREREKGSLVWVHIAECRWSKNNELIPCPTTKMKIFPEPKSIMCPGL